MVSLALSKHFLACRFCFFTVCCAWLSFTAPPAFALVEGAAPKMALTFCLQRFSRLGCFFANPAERKYLLLTPLHLFCKCRNRHSFQSSLASRVMCDFSFCLPSFSLHLGLLSQHLLNHTLPESASVLHSALLGSFLYRCSHLKPAVLQDICLKFLFFSKISLY